MHRIDTDVLVQVVVVGTSGCLQNWQSKQNSRVCKSKRTLGFIIWQSTLHSRLQKFVCHTVLCFLSSGYFLSQSPRTKKNRTHTHRAFALSLSLSFPREFPLRSYEFQHKHTRALLLESPPLSRGRESRQEVGARALLVTLRLIVQQYKYYVHTQSAPPASPPC